MVDRVAAGERITITRNGKPVAELKPLGRPKLNARSLLTHWAHIPIVDPEALKADIDALIDPSL